MPGLCILTEAHPRMPLELGCNLDKGSTFWPRAIPEWDSLVSAFAEVRAKSSDCLGNECFRPEGETPRSITVHPSSPPNPVPL